MKKYIKYSLEQKRDYWAKQLDNEIENRRNNKIDKPTTKQLYATGFLATSKDGRVGKNFNNSERAHKLGQIAGLKANIKGKAGK